MGLALRLSWRLVVAAVLMPFPASGANQSPIIFLGDRDLAPYEFLVNGIPRGANVELVQAIGRVLRRPVEVRLMDWGEAQRLVREGQADALTLLGQTPERESHYDFSRPTLPFAFALFIRTSDERDLAGRPPSQAFTGKRIGVTRAGMAATVVGDLIPEAKLVPVDNLLDGTRRLVNREIDAFAGQVWSQSFLIEELGIRGLMSLPPILDRRSNIAVRKGNADLLAEIDRALAQIEASGEMDEIISRWSTTRLRLVSEWTLITLTAAGATAAALLLALSAGLIWSRRQGRALASEVEERRRAEQALRESQLALQAADQNKDRFIATLAHELRNPLAPINNAVYLLEAQGDETPQARWAREVIGRQTLHLTRLIDDLLDVGRITSGKLELRRAPVMLATLLEEAIEGSRPAIERGGHRLNVNAPPDPVWMNVDRTRLVQALMNLLTNAAKYTPRPDDIQLSASVEGHTVTLAVTDHGVGIAASQLPQIFEMFHQEERAQEHSKGGLGIGLWLSRRLVEMHGGAIDAQSAGAGRGAIFKISLPGVVCGAPKGAQLNGSPGTPAAARILVVDDNVDAAQTMSKVLASLGHVVEEAHDGEQALQTAKRFRPDVVLLDLAMPGIDGFEVGKRLRAIGSPTRLVALSGWGTAADKARTAAAGFDAHLVKPVDHGELQTTIARLLAMRAVA